MATSVYCPHGKDLPITTVRSWKEQIRREVNTVTEISSGRKRNREMGVGEFKEKKNCKISHGKLLNPLI